MKKSLPAALTALALATPAIADDIAGVYKGTIFSGGDYPGTTIFTISEMGKIEGTYLYESDTGPAAGDLTDCVIEVRLLNCIWRDDFGKGDFSALFSADFKSFDGGWWEDVSPKGRFSFDGSYPWTGKRP